MEKMKDAVAEFMSHKRVAVTGVSREGSKAHGSNLIYQRLRQQGYEVFPVNPNADEVEGDPCFHDLKSIPGGVDWVVACTRPDAVDSTVHECEELDIKRVWMHGPPFGPGSVSSTATEFGRAHGMTVIDGGCPCMFNPTADPGHKVLRIMGRMNGKTPKRV